jgi:hypothetical protein
MRKRGVPLFRTTTMTTVGLPDTLNYATVELASCLVTQSAGAYGSESGGSWGRCLHPTVSGNLMRVRGWRLGLRRAQQGGVPGP